MGGGCVQPPHNRPVSETGVHSFLRGRREVGAEKDNTIFTCPFIKQELHDNLIQ